MARTDLGSCRLGNCTFGKLPFGKKFFGKVSNIDWSRMPDLFFKHIKNINIHIEDGVNEYFLVNF